MFDRQQWQKCSQSQWPETDVNEQDILGKLLFWLFALGFVHLLDWFPSKSETMLAVQAHNPYPPQKKIFE